MSILRTHHGLNSLLGITLLASGFALSACSASSSSETYTSGAGGADGGSAGKDGGTKDGGTAGKDGGTGGQAGSGGTGGTAGAGGTAGSGGTGGSGGSACSTDSVCKSSPSTPYCDTASGKCVACVAGDTTKSCANTLSCCNSSCVNTSNDNANCGACAKGCSLLNSESSCSAGNCKIDSCKTGFLDCDLDSTNGCEATNTGTGCLCEPGKTENCYAGANGTQDVGPCKAGTRSCNSSGSDWGPCNGQILPTEDSCLDNIDNDCDGVLNNGFPNVANCQCIPGSTRACYTGGDATKGVGTCHGGTETCAPSGTGYSLCEGEVTPALEVCANGADDDCNGKVDDIGDLDGDGWTRCQGDCCDKAGLNCGNPALVNPGAFEYPGNGVDDDCDGVVDNAATACDKSLVSNSANGLDYAKAMDICSVTTETPALNQKRWGVISGAFTLTDGKGVPAAVQRSLRTGFGTAISPKFGSSLAILSTGNAADVADTNPAFAPFQGGQNTGTTSAVPADWLAANGNNFPNAPGCPDPQGGTTGNNPIMLKLRIRVPTNAQSFSLNSYFFSSEFPEWVCSPYNDFFVALLNSTWAGQPANPSDRNLAFFDPLPLGGPTYPVGVNLATGNTGLFQQCLNGPTGCGTGSVAGTVSACVGITELAGTGFDTLNPLPQFTNDLGWCGASNRLGGGTGWLVTRGNVTPGETIEIRFAVWDSGDAWYDSLVLLDNFQWSVTPSQPGTGG